MLHQFKSITTLLAGLTSVIVVHETGHFLFCKLFDIKIPIFSIGFGPALFGYQFGETFFQLALLPLGGYVAIDPTSLAEKTYLQKLLVNIAGISFNFLFAFILMSILLYLLSTKRVTTTIEKIEPESPADTAGLQLGDTINAYNEISLKNTTENTSINTFLEWVRKSPQTELTLDIIRDNKHIAIPIVIGKNHPMLGPNIGFLGIHFEQIPGPSASFSTIILDAILSIIAITKRFAQILFGIFKKENREMLAGPIGIVTSLQNTGPYLFIAWLAMININVAFFNILPLPFLDGGHLVLDTIEALYGQPLPASFIQLINVIFLFLFLWFIIHISVRDIQKIRKR